MRGFSLLRAAAGCGASRALLGVRSAIILLLPSLVTQPARAMAWTCHGVTNTDLVSALKDADIITSPRVQAAMCAVDRALFMPPGTPADEAYRDTPQPIGWEATISAPHMHGYCLEMLADKLVPGTERNPAHIANRCNEGRVLGDSAAWQQGLNIGSGSMCRRSRARRWQWQRLLVCCDGAHGVS
jgi:hypothetical protein